jgi:hypothetical protein
VLELSCKLETAVNLPSCKLAPHSVLLLALPLAAKASSAHRFGRLASSAAAASSVGRLMPYPSKTFRAAQQKCLNTSQRSKSSPILPRELQRMSCRHSTL